MEITFTKTSQRLYEVLVQRDDGVLIQVPSFDRQGRLPHDIAHFVVETELRLARGFWGVLAAGAIFPQMKVVAGRQPPHAAQRSRAVLKETGQLLIEAECLVALMVEFAEARLDGNWSAVSARLNSAWKPRRSQRGPISPAEVWQLCKALREVEQQWQALAVGESITMTWATRGNKRSQRRRHRLAPQVREATARR